MRRLIPALAVVFSTSALAQLGATGVFVPPALEVERLAPQLQTFAGSPSNFHSLVTGLAQGSQVTLTSVAPDGFTEVVTFTPPGTLSATGVAQTLEAVRQQLITRGIAAPSASQIATAIVGGSLTTPSGTVPVSGVLSQAASAAANLNATVVPSLPAGDATLVTPGIPTATVPPGIPASGLTAAVMPRFNTSDNIRLGNTSDSLPQGAPLAATPAAPATAPVAPVTAPTLQNVPPTGNAPAGFIVRRR